MTKHYGFRAGDMHKKAHHLRKSQMRYEFVGVNFASEKTSSGFLPTPRHLLGGVSHTAHCGYARASAETHQSSW